MLLSVLQVKVLPQELVQWLAAYGLEPLLLVKGLLLRDDRPFLGNGDFAIMSTVTTSLERPLTEPELAEFGKQQARLLQDIGELVIQKKVAVDEFKARDRRKTEAGRGNLQTHQSRPGTPRHRVRCAAQHARERMKEFRCRCYGPDRKDRRNDVRGLSEPAARSGRAWR
jgi:hypothetical protein